MISSASTCIWINKVQHGILHNHIQLDCDTTKQQSEHCAQMKFSQQNKYSLQVQFLLEEPSQNL